ncbi:MAG: 50S ribosomal protein L34 [Candidatus Dojkabacteria bacterium]|nr:50S ribosomal protein L34 [Candidatus Dojkabacteria bacterium]MDQ7020296.1 50S ribosomal protein L34 [Candidatus Dojkabacteria bacterium]
MKKTQGLTYRPSKTKRIRKFGFMKRMKTWTGRNILKRKRLKKRAKLTASVEFGSKMEKNKKFSRRK